MFLFSHYSEWLCSVNKYILKVNIKNTRKDMKYDQKCEFVPNTEKNGTKKQDAPVLHDI